ncbi:hypothetical protein ACN08Z_04735 [Rothia sp. P7181]|uniref:hypothetical protein n=1 Tax=unclassified Rothia (in: high G+C Gram-positive bacteria) TaxID=2689056 RepID=UPI003AEA70F3
MPWWFWIVLWSVLVLVSVLWLAFHAYRMILKGASAFEEFLRLSDNCAKTWEESAATATRLVKRTSPPAIFTPVSESYASYEQGKKQRQQERISRRIQKRDILGQPQRVGDLRRNTRKGADSHG